MGPPPRGDCACVSARPSRLGRWSEKGRGRAAAPEEGWLGGAGGRWWRLRARARVRTGNAARAGAGQAVETTDGDYGRGSGRWRSWDGGGRRGCGRRGGGCGPGRLSAEGRGPGQQVLGEPGDRIPAGFGAGLAWQALQEGGFTRPWGPGGHATGAGAATGLAGPGPPLPPARHEGQQRPAPSSPRPRGLLSEPARLGLHGDPRARLPGAHASRAKPLLTPVRRNSRS